MLSSDNRRYGTELGLNSSESLTRQRSHCSPMPYSRERDVTKKRHKNPDMGNAYSKSATLGFVKDIDQTLELLGTGDDGTNCAYVLPAS